MRLPHFLLLLALICAPVIAVSVTAAERISGRYALILSDVPLAQGRGIETAAAHTARTQRIAAEHARLRSALAQSQFTVTGETQTVLNAMFVTATPDRVSQLESLPGVTAVVPLRRYRVRLNKAVPLLNAPAAWQALGGEQNAGRGLKIAIIDTGIDQNHPAFQDSTLTTPSGFPICAGSSDCSFTNNKVIVARSYIKMEAAGTGPATSRPDDYSPRDRIGHGTATAMSAAGNTNTGPSATITGMAPHAFVGNYKVFGTSAFATEDAIIQAVEDALNDGMDVASLSLGGSAYGGPLDTGATCGLTGNAPCDPLAAAVQNAVQAGMVIVAAAGNDGLEAVDANGNTITALSTSGSPGYAPLAIAAGATTNAHVWVAGVHARGNNAPSNLQNIAAQFGDGPLPSGSLTAPLRDVQTITGDPQGCSTIPQNSVQGAFALIERGNCNFVIKVQNAQSAGAAGVILYDTSSEPIIAPGGLTNTQIPAVFISQTDGQALKSYIASNADAPVTLDPTPFELTLSGAPSVSDFSSRGPVTGTGQIKPDIAAVGQDVYMATQRLDAQGEMYSATGYTVASGTSFSTPLVSGAAALVKQKSLGSTPGQIKSALVNNASQSVTGASGGQASALEAGGGLLDAGAAVNASVAAEPATISFGILNNATLPVTQTIKITNVSGGAQALSVSVSPGSTDARVSVSPASLSLPAGQSGTITVTLTGSPPQPGRYEGAIAISGGTTPVRIPYLYLMGDGTPFAIIDLNEGPPDFEGTINQPLPADEGGIVFKVIDQYGVPVSGLAARFAAAQRGQGSIVDQDSQTDSNGIAGAAIALGSQTGDQSFTGSAGGLTMTFMGTARSQPAIAGIVDAAGYKPNALVPGAYIAIFGTNLSDVSDQATVPALPPNMDEVSVSFDAPDGTSVPGYIYYVSSGQINVEIPWELQGQTSARVKVIVGESISSLTTVPIAAYAPAFFQYQLPGSGTLFLSALDTGNALITTANPARRGQTVQLFANGLGPVTNQPVSGLPAPSQPFAETMSTPAVTIGGVAATVSFSGLAPGFTGLYQLNVVVPGDAPVGVQPVVMSIGGVSSAPASIAIQ